MAHIIEVIVQLQQDLFELQLKRGLNMSAIKLLLLVCIVQYAWVSHTGEKASYLLKVYKLILFSLQATRNSTKRCIGECQTAGIKRTISTKFDSIMYDFIHIPDTGNSIFALVEHSKRFYLNIFFIFFV